MRSKEELKAYLIRKLVLHFGEDLRRIDHALRVLEHAEALLDEVPEADRDVVLAAAVMHDFGIREAERLHGTNTGPMQEKYGPPLVKEALKDSGLGKAKIDEVCGIVSRHHSPPKAASANFRILYESDWLVNAFDFPGLLADADKVERFVDKNFVTAAGKRRARRLFLQEESLFVHMGNVYRLMIDEAKRRAAEQPYLLELAEKARSAGSERKRAKGSTLVLDLACGTGFHSRLLSAEGYRVLGIDFSRSMLAEAVKSSPGGKTEFRWGSLLEPLNLPQKAALTLLVGNSLSLFSSRKDLARVMKHMAEATLPGGIAVIQILNYARMKQAAGSAVTKHGAVDGHETILTKSLQPTDDGNVLLSFTASQKSESGAWRTEAESTLLQAWSMLDVVNAGKRAGLRKVSVWGSMSKAPYHAAESSDCVIEFQVERY